MEKKTKYLSLIFVVCSFAMLSLFAFLQVQTISYAEETEEIIVSSNSIDYKNGTLLYTDTENKKIIALNESTQETTELLTVNTPKLVCADYDGNIFYTQEDSYGFFDKNQTSHDQIGTKSIGKVFDMDTDINGNVFAACVGESDKCWIVKLENDGNFSFFCEFDGSITINASSKISASLDKDFLILFTNNKFYRVEQSNVSTLADYEGLDSVESGVLDIKLDYYNSLYILSNQKITKHTKEEMTEFVDEKLTSASSFDIDYLNGTIYCRTSSKIVKIDSSNFVDPLQSSVNEDIKNQTFNCALIKTTKDANLYLYDNCLYRKTLNGENIVIEKDRQICTLDKKNGFYFVLLTNEAEQNITGFIKVEDAEIVEPQTTQEQAKILYNNTPLYSLPTTIDELFAKEENEQILLSKGTLYDVVISNFGEADFYGKKFSQILYHNKTYFIETNHYAVNSASTIQPLVEDENTNLNNGGGTKLTKGEIVGIILIAITVIVGSIFVIFAIIKYKNKKEL